MYRGIQGHDKVMKQICGKSKKRLLICPTLILVKTLDKRAKESLHTEATKQLIQEKGRRFDPGLTELLVSKVRCRPLLLSIGVRHGEMGKFPRDSPVPNQIGFLQITPYLQPQPQILCVLNSTTVIVQCYIKKIGTTGW